MRRLLLALVTLAVTSGCWRRAGRIADMKEEASKVMACPEEQLAVEEEENGWRVTGCRKEFFCDTVRRDWVCADRGSPEALARDRLALETGCPPDQVGVVSKAGAAFRLVACGKSYVCDSAGCKDALASQAPVTDAGVQ